MTAESDRVVGDSGRIQKLVRDAIGLGLTLPEDCGQRSAF
jgi:hypothetical protein